VVENKECVLREKETIIAGRILFSEPEATKIERKLGGGHRGKREVNSRDSFKREKVKL